MTQQVINLIVTRNNNSCTFVIEPFMDEIYQSTGWTEFSYPSLALGEEDIAKLDAFCEFDETFAVICYAYAEGSCVEDTLETEETTFSYYYTINGKKASYSDVYEALNPIE